jgi:hypothetical protein
VFLSFFVSMATMTPFVKTRVFTNHADGAATPCVRAVKSQFFFRTAPRCINRTHHPERLWPLQSESDRDLGTDRRSTTPTSQPITDVCGRG